MTPSRKALSAGFWAGLARFLINNGEYALERLSFRLGLLPSGQLLGHAVHEGHPAGFVGCDDAISDAGERGMQQVAARGSSVVGGLEIDNQVVALSGGAADIESGQ